ncbi:MAG TPA: type II toxin-antitoxin system VapC family toxin [Caulobacteraceae bacterium]|jgi:hypothetical protein|nr:type II toxin-antitoxin system VapC family toxin [Caulobacteraceae bacterium]
MIYLDTSVIVAAVTAELSTARTQAWLLEQSSETFVTSAWTVTEFSSALSLKLRTRHVSLEQRAAAMAAFHEMLRENLAIAEVQSAHFQAAAGYVDHHELGLRSGDALHLAVAADLGAILCTLDHGLARIGPQLSVPTILIR